MTQIPTDRLRAEIIENALGVTAIVGAPPRELLIAAAAAATEIRLIASRAAVDDARRTLEGLFLCPLSAAQRPDVVPQKMPKLSALLVFELPRGDDPLLAIGRLVSAVVDGGFILIDAELKAEARRRIDRQLETASRERRDFDFGPKRRVMIAVKEAPGKEMADRAPEPNDVAVLLYARAADAAAQSATFDVLFRQTQPPALLLCLDDAEKSEDNFPDDLWGTAAASFTQPALLRTGGCGPSEAFRIGLEHVDQKYVCLVDGRERMAPGAIAALSARLDAQKKLVAVVGGAVYPDGSIDKSSMPPGNVDHERATALFLERFTPAGAALLVRTTVLRKIADELRDGDPSRLPLALAELGPIGFLAAPLAVLANPDETAAASLDLSSHRALELPIEKIVASLGHVPIDRRRCEAHLLRAGYCARRGDTALARKILQSAIADMGPEMPLVRAAAHLARRMGDYSAMADLANLAQGRVPSDARLANIRGLAAFHLGDLEHAAAEFAKAAESAPEDAAVAWNGFLAGLSSPKKAVRRAPAIVARAARLNPADILGSDDRFFDDSWPFPDTWDAFPDTEGSR